MGSGGAGVSVGTSNGGIHWVNSNDALPTWATASALVPGSPHGTAQHSPMLRVRSPMRAARGSAVASAQLHAPQLAIDRRRGQPQPGSAARNPYLIATAHSPAPTVRAGAPRTGPSLGGRAASPLQSSPDMGPRGANMLQGTPVHFQAQTADGKPPWPSFLTPRSSSRPKMAGVVSSPAPPIKTVQQEAKDGEDQRGDRAWAFRFEGDQKRMGSDAGGDARSRAVSPGGLPTTARVVQGGYPQATAQVRSGQSPARNGTVYMTRSPSPMGSAVISARPAGTAAMRAPSPVAGGAQPSRHPTGGFSWAQAPNTYSPRNAAPQYAAGNSHVRAPSPVGASMGAGPAVSFAWSPDPPSPRTDNRSPRTFSPAPASGGMVFAQQPLRGLPMQTRRPGQGYA